MRFCWFDTRSPASRVTATVCLPCGFSAALGTGRRAVRRREVPLSTRTFVGSLAAGWGVSLIDHQILQIHHVVGAGNHPLWGGFFLASGVALMLAGWASVGAGRTVDLTRAT